MKKQLLIMIGMAALLGAGVLQAATIVTTTTFDGSGDVNDAANYDNGAPSNANPGLIPGGTGTVTANFVDDFVVLQTGGLISNTGELQFRGGPASGRDTIWEIEDPRTDYASYTSLSCGILVLWTQNGGGHKLRILSGVVDVGSLFTPTDYTKTVISMKNGMFHVDEFDSRNLINLKFEFLEGGDGSVTIGDVNSVNYSWCYLDFEAKSEATFTLGQNSGADAYPVILWLIDNGRVSIDGVVVRDRNAYLIERDGLRVTIGLIPPRRSLILMY